MLKEQKTKRRAVKGYGIKFTEKMRFTRILNKRPFRGYIKKSEQLSAYALQVVELEKFKDHYQLNQRKIKKFFRRTGKFGAPREKQLLILLERKLDNIVFKLQIAHSLPQSRQIILHGHIAVNGKIVRNQSYLVNPQDTISVKDNPKSRKLIAKNLSLQAKRELPEWLSVSKDSMSTRVLRLPDHDEISSAGDERLVAAYFSRQGRNLKRRD